MSHVTRALGLSVVLAATAVGVSLSGQTPAAGLPGLAPRAIVEEEIAKPAPIPDGFTPIFNGKDLSGWHVSKTNFHGTTPDFRVVQGVIVGTQNPAGEGGILLTDAKYRDVEVFMEVKPDWGCDSGLFLRSSEAGQAYQVTMDYLPGGTIGGIYGEQLQGVGAGASSGGKTAPPPGEWTKVWRREEWNTVRARIEGAVPHITVWVNDQLVTDFTDTANHAFDGAADGMIAIQVHRNGEYNGTRYMRWVPGGFWRWRTIAVKPLAR
jgi:hypothetical protein